jgi:hypothetical protein
MKMVNKVFVDGKEVFNARISIATNADNAPVVTPPVDDKPPPRPVEPPKGVSVRKLGNLTKTSAGRSLTIDGGDTVAYEFAVPGNTTVPGVIFSFAPQNALPVRYRVWLSTAPGGSKLPLKGSETVGEKRRGDQMQIVAALKNRGAESRGAVIEPGQVYYLNVKAGSGRANFIRWKIGGNFRG